MKQTGEARSGKKTTRPSKENPTPSRAKKSGPSSAQWEAERRAHAQSKIAQQRYRDLIEGLDSSMVWERGAETFQFTFVSERAEPLLGYPLEQ